ncbi:DUF6984 family protein [Acinetobacter guillouiae]|uniref:DUF6984 domain-containing protein n=1 Tax=Acinetobacter guillouiae NIPH 991 TaxID=1217656 RepID=N8YB68_ACIGI|nr:hypothetical protein [Acinetobacter guillouiae]ENV16545.1 hypothetical protein F964_03480 [Acinetobacter guillouiae NIPH 991]
MIPLTMDEIFIIKSLIAISPIKIKIPTDLNKCYSLPMNDGRMGSFKIIYPEDEITDFGSLTTSKTQMDYLDNGKYVNITLFIDSNFIPREIDSFVSDYSALTNPFNIRNIKKTYLTTVS